eukprot:scaffold329_cov92-Skeletonema_dohrnii-CCMP3373.AAC.7
MNGITVAHGGASFFDVMTLGFARSCSGIIRHIATMSLDAAAEEECHRFKLFSRLRFNIPNTHQYFLGRERISKKTESVSKFSACFLGGKLVDWGASACRFALLSNGRTIPAS